MSPIVLPIIGAVGMLVQMRIRHLPWPKAIGAAAASGAIYWLLFTVVTPRIWEALDGVGFEWILLVALVIWIGIIAGTMVLWWRRSAFD